MTNATEGTNGAFIERVRECLSYDATSGLFTWLKPTSNRVCAGSKAGNPTHGYIEISIDCKSYRAHRLAWLMTFAKWPDHFLDHINGDRADNRIANLREATPCENSRNMKMHSDNAIGFKGVSFYPGRRKPWRAKIYVNGRNRSFGYFATPEDAHASYMANALRVFGEFARSS